tara:strand:- start:276 stop:455 length:180 start_codon:yes stop_codon:yes gene_type:complete
MKTKVKSQVKSRFYYFFWGTATVAVVLGQLYVGTGYRVMAGEVLKLTDFLNSLTVQKVY